MGLSTNQDDIAIVGMSCRVAGASSPSELWENLVNSKDVQTKIDRFSGYFHPDGGRRKGLTNVSHAYTINAGVESFDNAFFSITPNEAVAMDVQQRLLLELTYEAFENAGITLEAVQGTDTAVYAGVLGSTDYTSTLVRDLDSTPKYMATGAAPSIIANRLSYFFDLHGPSMVIDTACSSTMVALHQAVVALKSRESKMAVVAGANVILDPAMFVHMSELGFFSPTGRCRSFDAGGNGYVRGEGILALVLKPLDDAIHDGDNVRAVIKATRINQDGRTPGLTMPSSEAQRANLEAIYANNNIDPLDIQYVEAHGTGTAVGDPLELSAINAVFSKDRVLDPLVVGSIKSNVGHLEPSAALAGVVKSVLSLEHGKIPPQMHLDTPNPKIDWSRVRVPKTVEEWPATRSGLRMAAVNSFGFGGTNGHAILQAYAKPQPLLARHNRSYLFMLSAVSKSSLSLMQENLAKYVDELQPDLLCLAHTLLARRSVLKYSKFITACSHEELITKMKDDKANVAVRSEEKANSLTWVFTGQGAQWPEMGAQMISMSPLFRRTMEELDEYLYELPQKPNWSIVNELLKPKQESRVYISSFSQPLCSAIQIGIVDVLRTWGVHADAVVGHSSGEVAAAYAAGILSRRDAIIVAFYRGLFLGQEKTLDPNVKPAGAMCAVGLSEQAALKLISTYTGRVALAAVNSPSSCTLSGDYDAVQEVIERCDNDGTFCRALRVDMAYHSHHMLPKSGLYQSAMENAGVQPLTKRQCDWLPQMFSSVFGRVIRPEECTPSYWKSNMVSTVKFHHALTAAATVMPPKVLLEIGPHPALKGPAGDTLAASNLSGLPYYGTFSRSRPDYESFLETMGLLISNRVPLDIRKVNAIETINCDGEVQHRLGNVLIDLPRYVWDHSHSFNAESRLSHNVRHREFARHEILGARLPMDNPLKMMWRNLLMTDEVTWLKDIVESEIKVLPESVYLSMVLEAARQVQISRNSRARTLRLQDIAFGKSLDLSVFSSGTTTVETLCSLCQAGDGGFSFSVTMCMDSASGRWEEACVGKMQFLEDEPQATTKAEAVNHCPQALQYYEALGSMIAEEISTCNVNSSAISGPISNNCDDLDDYHLDPVKFAEIIRLTRYLLSAQISHLYTSFRLNKISCMELPTGDWKFNSGIFRADVRRCDATSGTIDLILSGNKAETISIQGMLWDRLQKQKYQPPLRSLFFTSQLQQDISAVSHIDKHSLGDVVNLATCKWPMADIVITSLNGHLHDDVLPLLPGFEDHYRPSFRSLIVVGKELSVPANERITTTSSIKGVTKNSSHIIFGQTRDLGDLLPLVHEGGLLFMLESEDEQVSTSSSEVCFLGTTKDPRGKNWLVARKIRVQKQSNEFPKVTIFTCGTTPDLFMDHDKFEVVSLERSKTWTPPTEAGPVIVLDFARQSMLVDWQGSDILPWVQSLLEKTTHLLWVGLDNEQYVAPSFTKTVRAEHPEIKTAALSLQECSNRNMEQLILEVFHALVEDRAEAEHYFIGGIPHIKRYRPDDSLSASVGKLPPMLSEEAIGSQRYGLAISGSNKIDIVTARSPSPTPETLVEVQVHHSLIDWSDLQAFRTGKATNSEERLGFFCSGIISKSCSEKIPIGKKVVAWAPGSHSKVLSAHDSQILVLEESEDLVNGLIMCSLGALALCIIMTARAASCDNFEFSASNAVATTVDLFWKQLRDQFASSLFCSRTIQVDLYSKTGILVDGQPLDMTDFLEPQVQQVFRTLEWSNINTKPDVKRFDFVDAQIAFEYARSSGSLSVVLDHEHVANANLSTLAYCPPKSLLSGDKAYIIVGLGGLARHVAVWMARNGAKHVFAMSRRGLDSEDAVDAVEELKLLDCELEVLKVDACNYDSLSFAFNGIRQQYPIGGILNMVMVLGDSALLTMEPQQWDQCMTTKVKSTRNTHQASLNDSLDFFIMFSSIASIAGNRAQANYATANAFQNAFAQYRQSLGLCGIAIALGAVTGVGVLADDQALLRHFSQVGYYHITAADLEKILEAAINESRFRDRSLLTTGFKMFKTLDGKLQSSAEENQVYWAESPEFGFMMEHNLSGSDTAKDVSLKDKLIGAADSDAQELLLEGVLKCLSNVLGYNSSEFDPKSPVSVYGFDSLNAVSVRYWFFTQLGISVPVFDILGCKSINELVSRSLAKLYSSIKDTKTITIPEPHRHVDLDVRPLSHSQQRLFFLQRFIPDKTVFNLLLVCKAAGNIDVKRFRTAWNVFLQRHEVLYSSIISTESGFQQIPRSDVAFDMEYITTDDDRYLAASEKLLKISKSYEFNPEEGELVRGYLLESPSETKFFLASHHLAWDRSSASTVFGETMAIYKALGAGQEPSEVLNADPIQFIDYTLWQNECITKPEILDPQVSYWRKQLDCAPEAVSMLPAAINGTRPSVKEYSVDSVHFDLGTELTGAVKQFCKANAATPFMFLTSALTALVHRLTGDEDIVIGITDGDRGHSAFDSMVGFTVNMLPIRSSPKSGITFAALLEEYRTSCLEAYEHRSIPFDYLLQALQIPRHTAHSPVFQIAVNYQIHGAFSEMDYGDFQFIEFDHYNARIQTDFGLDIEETPDGNLQFTLDYDCKIYSAAGMKKFAEQYKSAIYSILQNEGRQNLGALAVDTAEDCKLIKRALQPQEVLSRPLSELDQELFPELFKQAVTSFPTKTALFDKSGSLTYAELDATTNAISNELIDSGVKVGDAVAVYCEQSVSLLLAIYGVIKAGAAYVPIDPDYPVARIESMIDDAGITRVLVDSFDKKAANLFSCGIEEDCIFEINKSATKGNVQDPCSRIERSLSPGDPLCCIFTSGSTGRPKGIYLTHSMLRYQQEEYNRILENSADDRIALGVAMVFDLSLCSIIGSILLGATTAIATREERYNPVKMIDMFVDERITSVILSPTQLKALFTAPNKAKLKQWNSLRNLTACGEALPPWIVREFHSLDLPHATFYNAYAPAETTVVNSMSIMTPDDAYASDCWIGGPMATNKFYILDKNLNPVPMGTAGELHIGGVTVAAGYVNRPELTQKVFHDDPWASEREVKNGFGKMYQTGDSFRLTEDGRLHCLGRIGGDRQVKIRGMRTELGEIEGAIFDASQQLGSESGHQLSLAAVVYPKDENGDGILVAHLCIDQGGSALAEDQQSFEQYLRTTLKGSLPPHMIPSIFSFVDEIPRTGSGKTDYKALLTRPLPQNRARIVSNGEKVSLTPMQERIATIWKSSLGLDGNIAPGDSFFALGGHSMMLINISSSIQKSIGVELQLADMFAQPTLAGMETLCIEASSHTDSAADEAESNVNDNNIHTNGSTDGYKASNEIDWVQEAALDEGANWLVDTPVFAKPTAIAMTGACSMIGAHFLQHVLSTTDVKVYCLAVDCQAGENPRAAVSASLSRWKLDNKISANLIDRVCAYAGSLSQPHLGLTKAQIDRIDTFVGAIYHLDSEVSLLKDYASIRAGNVGALHFLLNLAASSHNNPKPIHYLSTWGVPHLQAWNGTTSASADFITSEVAMDHMVPASTSDLGYLKCRWACEQLLSAGAKRGVPVTIIRTTMCAPSPNTGICVGQSDINRRILAGSLAIGAVPDFASHRGGGMSWITADVLTQGIWQLTHRKMVNTGTARINHVISEQHILYSDLAKMLSTNVRTLDSVTPEEWFKRLRAMDNAEMSMHAAVLERWWQAGWVPFQVDSKETMAQLREAGITPVEFDRELFMRLVVGEETF